MHISVGSPKSAIDLQTSANNVGATFQTQINHPNDPVANGWLNENTDYEYKFKLWNQLTPLGNLEKKHPFENYYGNGIREIISETINNE